jgi:hypothetical protein
VAPKAAPSRLEAWRSGPVTDLLVTAPDRDTLCGYWPS